MWKTVLFLLGTLLVVPILAYYTDEPPSPLQLESLRPLVGTYLVAAAICFIVSTITKNYSQVDKLWSILPVVYAWQIVFLNNWDLRCLLMAVVISLWGIRLSYNFYRRGGYSWKFWEGEEDYRWAILRAKPEFQPRWKWVLFNLFFISFYQMALILSLVFPMVKSLGGKEISLVDYLLAALVVFLIILEFIADQQQWDFQKEKYRRINSGEDLGDYAHGFTRNGLWKYARHPNYAAEQAIWVVIYFFSVQATGIWANWSVTGAILLILLFYGSSKFSEEVSAAKYPEYKEYQKKTARFIPFL